MFGARARIATPASLPALVRRLAGCGEHQNSLCKPPQAAREDTVARRAIT
jgi:hypothetical protein